jgi:hypothetical protein
MAEVGREGVILDGGQRRGGALADCEALRRDRKDRLDDGFACNVSRSWGYEPIEPIETKIWFQ